jgi:hypothetical protein
MEANTEGLELETRIVEWLKFKKLKAKKVPVEEEEKGYLNQHKEFLKQLNSLNSIHVSSKYGFLWFIFGRSNN